jgi:hypothetical protein
MSSEKSTIGHTMVGFAVIMFITLTSMMGIGHVKDTWIPGGIVLAAGLYLLKDE